jgi:hypothetical protein
VAKHYLYVLPLAPLILAVLGFKPFTQVESVCPSCDRNTFDFLILKNGLQVEGRIVTQNDTYYVIERYGEYRAIELGEVASIKGKAASSSPSPAPGDQILLKSGLLLHGTILEERTTRTLTIQVGSFKHVVTVDQLLSIHKGGHPYSLPTTPVPAPEGKR